MVTNYLHLLVWAPSLSLKSQTTAEDRGTDVSTVKTPSEFVLWDDHSYLALRFSNSKCSYHHTAMCERKAFCEMGVFVSHAGGKCRPQTPSSSLGSSKVSCFIKNISLHYVNCNPGICGIQKKINVSFKGGWTDWRWVYPPARPRFSLNAADWNTLLLSTGGMNTTIHLFEKHPKVPPCQSWPAFSLHGSPEGWNHCCCLVHLQYRNTHSFKALGHDWFKT